MDQENPAIYPAKTAEYCCPERDPAIVGADGARDGGWHNDHATKRGLLGPIGAYSSHPIDLRWFKLDGLFRPIPTDSSEATALE
jgi:hypothetical protein